MSKTPRTDEHLRMKEENGHVAIVSRDFARQLEAELADKEKQLAEARAEIARKGGGRKMKKKSPGLVVLEAVISNRVFPKTCGECRFWAGYSCILKPILRCKRDKVSRGCPLCTLTQEG
jgi:hypothetical protein